MDQIKAAFQRIKEEMISLQKEIAIISERICSIEDYQKVLKTPTHAPIPTDTPTYNPALPQEIKGFKMPFSTLSTGNKGVPTDKPTDRQTNQQTGFLSENKPFPIKRDSALEIERFQEALHSLDSIRKEIRLKFKRLTNKEMLIFSTIYSLEERGIEEITYKLLANNLNLTESSIRDYINKLISKGIPLQKERFNNKQIYLKISQEFQRIASLQTVLHLRDL